MLCLQVASTPVMPIAGVIAGQAAAGLPDMLTAFASYCAEYSKSLLRAEHGDKCVHLTRKPQRRA